MTFPARILRMCLAAAPILAFAAGCESEIRKPADLKELREFLLGKAEEKLNHSFRISLKYSNVPFNQARQQLIYVYVQQGKFNLALETAEEFLRQNKEYVEDRRKILASNQEAWEKKIAGDPKLKDSRTEKEYLDSKREVEEQVARAEKTVADTLILQGDIFLRMGKTTESIARYKEILEGKPSHASALARLGQAHMTLGNYNLAAGYLEKSVQRVEEVLASVVAETESLNPDDPKDKEKLDAVSARANELQELRDTVLVSTGLCHFLAGEFESFADAFARILENDPDSVFLPLKVGLTLLKDGHLVQGKGEIEKFLLKYRGNPEISALAAKAKDSSK